MCSMYVSAKKLNDVKECLDFNGYSYSVERNWERDESWGIEYIVSVDADDIAIAGIAMACGL